MPLVYPANPSIKRKELKRQETKKQQHKKHDGTRISASSPVLDVQSDFIFLSGVSVFFWIGFFIFFEGLYAAKRKEHAKARLQRANQPSAGV